MKLLPIISSDDTLEGLRLWHGGETNRWPLAHMRLGWQLAQEQNIYSSLADSGPASRNRAILDHGLQSLKTVSPDAEELLRYRFEHRLGASAVANRLNIAESSLFYRQRQAVNQLTEILISLEEQARIGWQEKMLVRLQLPTYTKLVGVDKPLSQLIDALLSEGEPHIVSIDGLGGLGKTALADKITRELIQSPRFEEIAWITAKHTYLSSLGRLQISSGRAALTLNALINELIEQFELPEDENLSKLQQQRLVKQFLRDRSCLVVIDNLETVEDYRTLLPELRKWQSPSKFLITSRLRLLDEMGVYSISLKELTAAAALELIRNEAEQAGFTALLNARESELTEIYKTVGGNPLALKLIVGQLKFYPLDRVLARFEPAKHKESREDLFKYIYLEIWEQLNDDSKRLLLAIAQAGETGFTLEHIANISSLSEQTVITSLEDLILRSLVDQGGSLLERRYRLHRLTELFLLHMLNSK